MPLTAGLDYCYKNSVVVVVVTVAATVVVVIAVCTVTYTGNYLCCANCLFGLFVCLFLIIIEPCSSTQSQLTDASCERRFFLQI